MLDAASMFEKFKGTGLLFSTTWTPAGVGGVASAPFEARLMKGNSSDLAQIGASELAIQFMSADAPTINQGDSVTVNGATYKLRDRDESNCSADGTLMAYFIRKS